MSEIKEQQPAYISRVHLKGYKSIRDLEIDFKAGLNIIIGPNGSGKTNFLECVYLNHELFFEGEDYSIAITSVVKSQEIKIEQNSETILTSEGIKFMNKNRYFLNKELLSETHYLNSSRKKNVVIYDSGNHDIIADEYTNHALLIQHGNPFDKIFSSNLDFNVNIHKDKYAFIHLFNSNISRTDENMRLDSIIENMFNLNALKLGELKIESNLINSLEKYTPIKDVKILNERIYKSVVNQKIIFENIAFNFLVGQKWFNYNQLSDGTKRMFYLFACFNSHGDTYFIEEPELGTHPQQLSLLMDFLREQSREKQIIITTHSPQVLNELREDELDRIIVTRHEGAERGTQMYHLSEEEKGFAIQYMQNGAFLSDYWVQSGFVKEEAIE